MTGLRFVDRVDRLVLDEAQIGVGAFQPVEGEGLAGDEVQLFRGHRHDVAGLDLLGTAGLDSHGKRPFSAQPHAIAGVEQGQASLGAEHHADQRRAGERKDR